MKQIRIKYLLLFLSFFCSNTTNAHVKWFSSFDFSDSSKTIEEVINPMYWGLTVLSIVVVALLIFLDRRIKNNLLVVKVNTWLDDKQKYSSDVIRVAIFTVLFVSWVNNTILTPELEADNEWVGWLQFVIALVVLIKSLMFLSGGLLICLYFYCIYKFGFFYMLDYYHFLGIGIYLITIRNKNKKIASLGIPSLYVTLGLALIWLAYEKLYYPAWSLVLLEQYPSLTMGLPHEFFLQSAAFIEIGLGFMLLYGAMSRALAAIITLVFVITATIFGKVEVIGHTSLHAMLIVFILTGTGAYYKAPISRFHKLNHKIIVGVVSYLYLSLLALFMYKIIDNLQDRDLQGENIKHCVQKVDLSTSSKYPKITLLEVVEEKGNMGINLHAEIENWRFTPENTGKKFQINQGHAHVYVDGKKQGRMYSNWYYIGKLKGGKHKITITLNGDDHTDFVVDDKVIGRDVFIDVKNNY